jgi:hypothetical protein
MIKITVLYIYSGASFLICSELNDFSQNLTLINDKMTNDDILMFDKTESLSINLLVNFRFMNFNFKVMKLILLIKK